MSAGLFGLLDDIAALAKLAAASIDDVGAAAEYMHVHLNTVGREKVSGRAEP